MVKNIRRKSGIAMIELIFALVIMGIVLMSAPMLIQQSIKSSNVALQQEAIVAAASQTAIVLSMHWDENNTHSGTSAILNATGATGFTPAGLANVTGREVNQDLTLTPSNIGPDNISNIDPDLNETTNTKYDDVDDYDGSSLGLMLFNTSASTADIGEYVDTSIEINTTIRYTPDGNVSGNLATGVSNIKGIHVNLTSRAGVEELEKDITFEAFSCNIGTYDIYGKAF